MPQPLRARRGHILILTTPMPTHKINDYTRRLIVRLRLKGMKGADIAREAHVHESTVSRICREERIQSPRIPRGYGGGRPQGSKSKKTAAADDRPDSLTGNTAIAPHRDLVMLARQGYTIGDIAVAFSISLDEVNRRIREHLMYMRLNKPQPLCD